MSAQIKSEIEKGSFATRERIDSLKDYMRGVFPLVAPTARVEALARGLGYNTYSGLLADLSANMDCPAKFDADVFDDYLLRADQKNRRNRNG